MNRPAASVPLRALLVDDERLASKRLRTLLLEHGGVEIIGEARTLVEARALLAGARAPDVVFLDIQLSPENGFDLIGDLTAATQVVFVSAHETFAVRAFETEAVDYLLKPVNPARLATTLERLVARRGEPESETATPAAGPTPPEEAPPLLVRDGRNWHQLQPEEIFAIQGEGTYTRVDRTQGPSLLILRTLASWMELLPEGRFARLSRSLVVNLERIERLENRTRNRSFLYFRERSEPLEIGRVASAHLRKILQEEG